MSIGNYVVNAGRAPKDMSTNVPRKTWVTWVEDPLPAIAEAAATQSRSGPYTSKDAYNGCL